MAGGNEIRPGEVSVPPFEPNDARLVFIGTIRTPWTSRAETPRQGSVEGPECRIEVDDCWSPALDGIEAFEKIEVLYWLHEARRDLVRQSPARDGTTRGTFALRSPVRPNPIGTATVRLLRREGPVLVVRGLDCLDGTPLVDLKPVRCPFARVESPQPAGDGDTEEA